MPRISDETKAARREQILRAARRCFADQGFHRTSMDDVIRAAGLSSGAVYGYFRSKDELLLATADDALTRLGVRARETVASVAAAPDAGIAESVTSLLRMLTGFADAEGGFDLTRIALHSWGEALHNPELAERLAVHYRALRSALTDLARGWQARGLLDADRDADAVGKVLFSTVLGFITQRHLLGDVTVEDLAEGFAALSLR